MYLCMTEGINYKNQKYIIHGKALPKNIAYNNASIKYNPEYYSSLFSWVQRADKPHKCNIKNCPLFRTYLRNELFRIGYKGLMYNETKKILKLLLPDDILQIILKICYSN